MENFLVSLEFSHHKNVEQRLKALQGIETAQPIPLKNVTDPSDVTAMQHIL